MALAQDFNLETFHLVGDLLRHIAERDRSARIVCITAGGHPATHLAPEPDRFVADDVGIMRIDDKGTQAQLSAARSRFERCGLAYEIRWLGIGDEADDPGYYRIVDRPVFASPGAVVLFQPQRIQRPRAEKADTKLFAGLHQCLKNMAVIFRRHPDRVAEIARIADAADNARSHAHNHWPARDERESPIRDIRASHLGKHVARFRTSDGKADPAKTEGLDADRTVGRQMRFEPAHVILLGNAGAQDEPFATLLEFTPTRLDGRRFASTLLATFPQGGGKGADAGIPLPLVGRG